ncbi:MAG: hypothetical protein R2877_04435 [Bdellovibrionota bacterium]
MDQMAELQIMGRRARKSSGGQEEEETLRLLRIAGLFHDILGFAQNIQVFLQEEVSSLDNFEVYTALDTKVMDKIEQYFQSVEAPKKSIQKLID